MLHYSKKCVILWDANVVSEILGHYKIPVCIENCCIKKTISTFV